MASTRKTSKPASYRERFNWGYHDGVADAKAGRKPVWVSPHFDAIYEMGYVGGVADWNVGADTTTSTPAWVRNFGKEAA